MIEPREFRLGNILMQKTGTRISPKNCGYEQWEMMAMGRNHELYPVMLKPEWLEKSGFVENKKYALLPAAREFVLQMPLGGKAQINAYVKSNGECFARAMVENIAVSTPVHQLHQLQNLYYALTGEELQVVRN